MTPDTASPATALPLRDIHLPDPIGIWPPAPGWWLIALLVLAITGLTYLWFRKTAQRRKLFRSIHDEFEQIASKHHQRPDDLLLVNALSRLLRRIAISTSSRKSSASLTGNAWLEYLDTGIAGNAFSRGAGRCLIEAPYNPNTVIDSTALLQLCRQWIDGRKAIRQE